MANNTDCDPASTVITLSYGEHNVLYIYTKFYYHSIRTSVLRTPSGPHEVMIKEVSLFQRLFCMYYHYEAGTPDMQCPD